MSGPLVAPLDAGDDDAVVAYVTAAQGDPTRHVTFVGEGEVSVRGDIHAVHDWRAHTLVATDERGRVVGVLVVDTDAELGRCWWMGPWADDDDIARALLAAAEPLVAELPTRDFAPDARNTTQATLATSLGYQPRPPSAILALDLSTWDLDSDTPHVHQLDAEDRDVVAALHDRLFPGTHTPGRRLVRDDATTILVTGEPPHGYVATQDQEDASLYIDFLGVDPGARRRGLGQDLLVATLRLAQRRALERAFLTVHVSNTAARALYAGLGFEEERHAQPFILKRRR